MKKYLKKIVCYAVLTAFCCQLFGGTVAFAGSISSTQHIGLTSGAWEEFRNLMKIPSFEGVTANTYGLNLHNTVATDSNYWDVNGAGDSSANTTGIVNDVYHTGSASLRVDENNASWTKTDTYSGRPRIKVMNINEVSNIGGLMSADKQATVSVWLKAVDNVSSWTMCIGTDAHHNADPMDFRLKQLYEAEADGTNWVNLTAEIDFSQFDYSMFPDSGVCTGGTGSYDSSTKESVLDARWTIQIWANRTDESSNASYYVDDFDIICIEGLKSRPVDLIDNITINSTYGIETDDKYTFNNVPSDVKYLTINTKESLKPGEFYEVEFMYTTSQSENGTLYIKNVNEPANTHLIHRTSHATDLGKKERHMALSRKFEVTTETSEIYLTHICNAGVDSFTVWDVSLTKATDSTYKPILRGNRAKVQFLNIVKDFSEAVVRVDGVIVSSAGANISKVNSKVLSVPLPEGLAAGEHSIEISGVKVLDVSDVVTDVSGTLNFVYQTEMVTASCTTPHSPSAPIVFALDDDIDAETVLAKNVKINGKALTDGVSYNSNQITVSAPSLGWVPGLEYEVDISGVSDFYGAEIAGGPFVFTTPHKVVINTPVKTVTDGTTEGTKKVSVELALNNNTGATADVSVMMFICEGQSIKYVGKTDVSALPSTQDGIVVEIDNVELKTGDYARLFVWTGTGNSIRTVAVPIIVELN